MYNPALFICVYVHLLERESERVRETVSVCVCVSLCACVCGGGGFRNIYHNLATYNLYLSTYNTSHANQACSLARYSNINTPMRVMRYFLTPVSVMSMYFCTDQWLRASDSYQYASCTWEYRAASGTTE